MSENTDKSKLGSNPLGGGALDWLDEAPAPPEPKRKAQPKRAAQPKRKAQPSKKKSSPAKANPRAKTTTRATETPSGRGEAPDADSRAQTDSTRRGVAAGYRRHTLLMREDQIEQLDRLYALDKLQAGSSARTKKDLVEEAFDLFFESERSNPRG
jgi:hypothetical protein